jgi:hypothetical protein
LGALRISERATPAQEIAIMPPRMFPPQALSILHAHAAKHEADFLVDQHLAAVARGVSSGVHPELFWEDLAAAITVVWDHLSGQVQNLDYFVIEPTGNWDTIRVVEKERADE